jgi:hypothetical protein
LADLILLARFSGIVAVGIGSILLTLSGKDGPDWNRDKGMLLFLGVWGVGQLVRYILQFWLPAATRI